MALKHLESQRQILGSPATFTLYFAPDSCSRVPLIALEEIGCLYELQIVKYMAKQHRSEAYLALNPQGKVPTLLIGDQPLTENVAILTYLADRFPDAKLLPAPEDALARGRIIADLAFCAAGLHPIVTRIRIPQFFCDIPDSIQRVYDLATAAMHLQFEFIERRLSKGAWWYGNDWSIMDAYLNWVWFRVTGAGFDGSKYPCFHQHDREITRRPSVKRALDISKDAAANLAAAGLAVQFNGPGAIAASAR